MIGQTNNSLQIVALAPRRHKNRPRYVCACVCGNTVTVDHYHFLSGHTSSCGCKKLERLVKMNKTHGNSRSAEYKSWTEAKYRTGNPNHHAFANYGGRGISFCERWKDFKNFLEDMGRKPKGYTLERIDVNGNYEPNNCKWVSRQEQAKNKTNTVRVLVGSQVLCASDAAKLAGVPRSTFYRHIAKNRHC
jgi:hypothetical protein